MTVVWAQLRHSPESLPTDAREIVPHAVSPVANLVSVLTGVPPTRHDCWTPRATVPGSVRTVSERLTATDTPTAAAVDPVEFETAGPWQSFDRVSEAATPTAAAAAVRRVLDEDEDPFVFARPTADTLTAAVDELSDLGSDTERLVVTLDPVRTDDGPLQPVVHTTGVTVESLAQPVDLLATATGVDLPLAETPPRTTAYTQHRTDGEVVTTATTSEYRYRSGDTTERLVGRERGVDRTADEPTTVRRLRRRTADWLDQYGDPATDRLHDQLRDMGYL